MHSDPLLTQAELDFIQQLTSQPPPRPAAKTPQLAIGDQLSELLSQLTEHEQISLDTHSDSEHLSFPLRLIKEDRSHSRLELGPPLIFEQGALERPWRLSLTTPLVLLDANERPSGLKVLELSNNGMLVQHSGVASPAKDRLLQLLLQGQCRVQLHAQLVRRVNRHHYAYRLLPLDTEDEQNLRQYLFEQHSARQRPAEPAA